jgi:hypothetical protein
VRVPGEVRPPHEVPAPDEGPAPREARELRGRGARPALLHLLAYAVAPLRSSLLQRSRSKLPQCECSIGTWHHLRASPATINVRTGAQVSQRACFTPRHSG